MNCGLEILRLAHQFRRVLPVVFDLVRQELSFFFARNIENSFAGCGDNPRRA